MLLGHHLINNFFLQRILLGILFIKRAGKQGISMADLEVEATQSSELIEEQLHTFRNLFSSICKDAGISEALDALLFIVSKGKEH